MKISQSETGLKYFEQHKVINNSNYTLSIFFQKLLFLSFFFALLVFATTAANPHESSYACYYSKKYQTYLGDVYSVKWMENSDKVFFNKKRYML